jgi:hypothetical protein
LSIIALAILLYAEKYTILLKYFQNRALWEIRPTFVLLIYSYSIDDFFKSRGKCEVSCILSCFRIACELFLAVSE